MANSAFLTDGSFENLKLYVTPDAREVFKESSPWDTFGSIEEPLPPYEFSQDYTGISVSPGETLNLDYRLWYNYYDNSLSSIFWESSNPKFATVDLDGNVKVTEDINSLDSKECVITARTLYESNEPLRYTLFCKSSPASIHVLEIDECASYINESGNVYNVSGLCILQNASTADLKKLPKGVYIFNGKKIIK